MNRWIVFAAGVLGCTGVMLGAFAAHGLEEHLQQQALSSEDIAKRMDQCQIAVRYQLTHTLALLAIGLTAGRACPKKVAAAAVFFLLGIALFSGGLYSMVFLGKMGHWAIVPTGGLCFMIGWICVTILAVTKPPTS